MSLTITIDTHNASVRRVHESADESEIDPVSRTIAWAVAQMLMDLGAARPSLVLSQAIFDMAESGELSTIHELDALEGKLCDAAEAIMKYWDEHDERCGAAINGRVRRADA